MKRIVILWCIIGIVASLLLLASINLVLANQGDPYFYSFDYSTYDSDNDGVDDAVMALFDPDFPIGYSGSVIVNVELYLSDDTLIKSVSGTYLLSEHDYDYLELDVEIVSIAGSFYLYGEILFNSVSTDTITTDGFRLGLSPYFYSFDWSTYDTNYDGTHEGVKAEFDPDFPGEYSDTVTVEVDLYRVNRTLINSASGTYSLNGDDYDSFELDLGSVSTADDYYLVGKILFNSITTDTMTTSTFTLGSLPFFYSFDYITYDANNDGFDDGVKAEFDPDFPSGSSGTVIVYVDLYKSLRTLINSISGTYFLNGNGFNDFEIDLGTVNTSGTYYLFSEIFFSSTSSDQVTTTPFYLYGLVPTIGNNETSTSGTLISTLDKTMISVERTGYKRGQIKTEGIIDSATTGFGNISFFIGVFSLIIIIWLRKRKVE